MELLPVHLLKIKTILFVDNVFRASNIPPYLVDRTLLSLDQERILGNIMSSKTISKNDEKVLDYMYEKVKESGDVWQARRLYGSQATYHYGTRL